MTLIRVPPYSDFEQGAANFHEKLEEICIVTRGTLTMRLGTRSRRGRDELRPAS
ncbi:MAG TPA: hypothetical protein VN756_03865 [Solirubrobacterales bacterium]|nr:hypothetical protein [Solirubrobacterales bacterium]